MSDTTPSTYRIVRMPDGKLHLCRGEVLVDVDGDPEQAPLEEIFRYGSNVVWAEERLNVTSWVDVTGAEGVPTYVAEVERSD